MSNTSRLPADLSPREKRALLSQLLRGGPKAAGATPGDGPMPASGCAPEGLEATDISMPASEPASILLTGATGFLGAFLLHELLRETGAAIYCLVPAGTDAEAGERLRRCLEAYSLWDPAMASRLTPLAGDLSRPNLGLSAERFGDLATRVDAIYHSVHDGTIVNLTCSYSPLPDVLGTREVLRLAGAESPKAVHYVSDVLALAVEGQPRRTALTEHDRVEDVGAPDGGYAQGKWVAERLVSVAASRGIPSWIYRVGRVSGHTETGVWNRDDHVLAVMKACLLTRRVPSLDVLFDMAPVDYVSRAIVHLSRHATAGPRTFHLVNPHRVDYEGLIDWIRDLGYALERVPYDTWRAALLELARRSPEDGSSYGLVPATTEWAQIALKQRPRLDCRHTLDGLAGTSIACPTVPELLERYASVLGLRLGQTS